MQSVVCAAAATPVPPEHTHKMTLSLNIQENIFNVVIRNLGKCNLNMTNVELIKCCNIVSVRLWFLSCVFPLVYLFCQLFLCILNYHWSGNRFKAMISLFRYDDTWLRMSKFTRKYTLHSHRIALKWIEATLCIRIFHFLTCAAHKSNDFTTNIPPHCDVKSVRAS